MAATHEDRNAQLSPGVAIKAPCRAATTAAITLSGEQTIDAVACVTGDRVLVKNQTSSIANGIYGCSTGAWAREPDFDGNRDVVTGTFVFITSGATNAGAFYECTTAGTVVFGTSNITFAVGALGPIALPLNLSNTTFTQAGTGATARTGLEKTRDIVSVKDFGAVGDGVTDDTAAINAWFVYLAATAQTGYVPAGTYLHATKIVVPNFVTIQGAGGVRSVFKYTGTDDQFEIVNPSNSSTTAKISFRDIFFTRTQATAGKANIADNGSTFLTLKNCTFSGAAINVILDQSELVDISECDFGAIGTIGLWIVNGAQRTVGNVEGLSNRISVRSCNFNTGICIADDGGSAHSFLDNNYNAGTKHLRLSNVRGLVVMGGEAESATTAAIHFAATKVGGGAASAPSGAALVQGMLYSGNTLDVLVDAAALTNLNWSWNTTNHATNPLSGLSNCVLVHAEGNTNLGAGVGLTALNNYWELDFSATVAIAFGGSSTNVTYGTRTATATRRGARVDFDINLVLTNNGTGTGSATITGLPITSIAGMTTVIFPVLTQNVTLTTPGIFGAIGAGVTSFGISRTVTNAALTALTEADIPDTGQVAMHGSYIGASI